VVSGVFVGAASQVRAPDAGRIQDTYRRDRQRDAGRKRCRSSKNSAGRPSEAQGGERHPRSHQLRTAPRMSCPSGSCAVSSDARPRRNLRREVKLPFRAAELAWRRSQHGASRRLSAQTQRERDMNSVDDQPYQHPRFSAQDGTRLARSKGAWREVGEPGQPRHGAKVARMHGMDEQTRTPLTRKRMKMSARVRRRSPA